MAPRTVDLSRLHQNDDRRCRGGHNGPIDIALGLLGVVALVLATAFFVAIEFSLVAVDRARLEQLADEGARRAPRVLALLGRLHFALSGAQLGITVMSVLVGVVVADALSGPALPVGLVAAGLFQMVIGELVPKRLAIARPERTAMRLVGAAAVYARLAAPLIRAFGAVTGWTLRRLGREPVTQLAGVRSLEELEHLIRSSGEEGSLGPEAYTLLQRTLRFGERTAADALVPRVDVEWVPAEATVADLVERAAATGHSRFPVTAGDLDQIVGVVHVKDAARLPFEERAPSPVTAIMQPPHVVPETADLTHLLREFRNDRRHLAVVVDEYGGTAGVLTLEDVLEELVGDIADEHDPAPPRLSTVLPAGTYELPGTMHLDDVRDACGLALPDGPYETLAGFVVTALGRIPEAGDATEHAGWRLEVGEMDRRRVALVRVVAP